MTNAPATVPTPAAPAAASAPAPESAPTAVPRREAAAATDAPASTRTASAAPAGSTRDRLLDAAAELFYRDGVNVGIDALCKAAGVSKRSMYQLFDSKDAVLAASLERSSPAYQRALRPAEDDTRAPKAQIMHVFERLEELAQAPEYLGCPFVSTAVELKDARHPASVVARRAKLDLTEFFRSQAQRGGAADPETLAAQLTIVFDGVSARIVVVGGALGGLAVTTAAALMAAGGMD